MEDPWVDRAHLLDVLDRYLSPEDERLITVVPWSRDGHRALLNRVLAEGGEGIILKRLDGRYYPGQRPAWNWVKVKAEDEDDVVIMGFEPPEMYYTGGSPERWPYRAGSSAGDSVPVTRYWYNGWIGAITFGKYTRSGVLVKMGSCSGMDDATRERMSGRGGLYVGRVMKIKYMERTRDGAYRHVVFRGMHEDKNAVECMEECMEECVEECVEE